MNKKIEELAREAGFTFWENEYWGPGEGHVDPESIDEEGLIRFYHLVRNELLKDLRGQISRVKQ